MFPILFISHGAPNIVLKETQTKYNLRNIKENISNPQYIIVISSHWVTSNLEIISPNAKELMYDFYGFEKELYSFEYKILSQPSITQKIKKALEGFMPIINENRKSFDHGVWSALYLLFERVKVPVIQLSLPQNYSAKALLDLGKALKSLRHEALIVCSGAITHNLYDINPHIKAPIKTYAKAFNDFIDNALTKGALEVLLEYEKIPFFKENHPTSEHFTPLLIALGASSNYQAQSINSEMTYSNISMSSYLFKG